MASAVSTMFCSVAFALNPSLDINQYAHKSWKVREGFFKGSINTIAQTPDGYLWVGTELGLYRFDGVRSVLWPPLGNEKLPSNVIHKLFVSRDGALWIGTHKGLAKWNGSKLTLYPELPAQEVDALTEDREGAVWAGLENVPAWRLCAIRKGSVQCLGDLGLGVGYLLGDRQGNVWAGTGTGLWRGKPGSPETVAVSGPAPEIHDLIEEKDGAVLISTRGGIIRFIDGKTTAYKLPDYAQQLNPFGLLRDRDNGLWIATKDRGLLHVHRGSTDHFGKSEGLSGDFVQDLLEDREGNVWVATAAGLDSFREFTVSTMTARHGFSVSGIESILTATDGGIWLGTRSGLDRWQDGRVTLYRKERVPLPATVPQIIDPGLPDDLHGALYEDHGGRIWVFSRAGAAWLDKRGRFNRVPDLPGGYAHAITEDSAGDLWVSQDQGFYHLRREGKVEQIPWATLQAKGPALALAGDPSRGGLWLGFSQGGVAYFQDGRVRESYTAAEGLAEGSVYKLLMDQDGTLWAGAEGGLSRIRSDGIHTLRGQNGLPCNLVHEFVRDSALSLWLNTGCGLVRIARPDLEAWIGDPRRKIQTTLFDSSDGLTPVGHPGGLSPRMGESADGKIWFLSDDGTNVVDPQHLPWNNIPPPIHIEQITADGKAYAPASALRLPARVRDVSIDYTALSLVAPEKVRFRFKLEGEDGDWRDVVNDRQVQYSNLAPGPYRFRVTACNNNGVWNTAGDTLEFSVAPAYYQATWFRTLSAAALLGLLWVAYQLRDRRLQRQYNLRLEERLEERTRIARELHDTLLQSFQGLMFSFQAARNLLPGRTEDAIRALDKAIHKGDEALADGRDAIQGLRANPSVDSNLERLIIDLGKEQAASSSADGKAPAFQVTVEGSRRPLSPVIQDEVYRIAREILRNAFHHAHASRIETEMTYDRQFFRLRIRDNGKGIDRRVLESGARQGHFGLPGVRERAKRIGARLKLWSEPGAGTETELTVPARIAYGAAHRRDGMRLFRKYKAES